MHYWFVVRSGRSAAGQPPVPSGGHPAGAAVELANVVLGGSEPGTGRDPHAEGVSTRVPAGQSLALFGQPRGTATELLDVLAGLTRPRSGQVLVDGVAVSRLGGAALDRYRARRGLVSARYPLLPSLSVMDNVLATPPARRPAGQAPGRAARLLEFAGASGLAGPAHRLPAADQWRVMIARALMASPRLVLAEEPAPGLDQRTAGRILDVLMNAHAAFGFTLVMVADRPATAARCQRRVVLARGKVTEDDVTSGDDAWTRSRIDRIG